MTAARAPIRVVVVGSCVARDTFSRLPAGRFTLVDYVARQSLITAAAPEPEPLRFYREHALTSRFQRRVTRSSLLGDLDERLRAAANATDLLLWDVMDERLGVYAMPGGSSVTRTIELIASGAEPDVARVGRLLELGTDEHFAAWADATGRWLGVLAELRLDDRLVLVRVPWAERSRSGAAAPSSFGVPAAAFNTAVDRYYRFVAARAPGVRVATPGEPVFSSSENVWGDAPFHYDEQSYRAVADALVAAVDDPHGGVAVPRPVVVPQSGTRVSVTTAVTWGATFALQVTRAGRPVARLRYQREPRFTIDLPGPGRYGFRLFHRSADGQDVAAGGCVGRLPG